ncbi:hypothetical protein ACIP6I_34965 [Streptomyces anulatus]
MTECPAGGRPALDSFPASPHGAVGGHLLARGRVTADPVEHLPDAMDAVLGFLEPTRTLRLGVS